MKNKLEFVLVLQTKLLLASVLSSRMASLQIWHPQERFWLCVCDSLFKDKVFLFARSNVRVILQHASHVFVMSLKPPLFLWSRLFPSLNRGLKENIKLVRTNRNLKGQNGQDIKNKPRSKDAGLDVCPAFIHLTPFTAHIPASNQARRLPLPWKPPLGINGQHRNLQWTVIYELNVFPRAGCNSVSWGSGSLT